MIIYTIVVIFIIKYVNCAFLGPSDITIERIEKCGDDLMGVKIKMSIEKVNRSHSGINYNMITPFDWDKTVASNVTIAKWGDGGWKPNMVDISEQDVCEAFKKYFKNWAEALEKAGRPKSCPVKAGTFVVEKFIFGKELSYPVMYGYFRVDFALIKNGIMFSCVRFYVRCAPKKIKFG